MALDIPPGMLTEVKHILDDPTCDCYMVVGTESSPAWDRAQALEIDMPPLRTIRVQSRSEAKEWLQGNPDAVGIVFGYGNTPKDRLSKAEAEEKDTVAQKINDAR